MFKTTWAAAALTLMGCCSMIDTSQQASAQRPGVNQDESKVPHYELPELLVCNDGTEVGDSQAWETRRRPKLLELFKNHIYGQFPKQKTKIEFSQPSPAWEVLDGTATRREILIHFGAQRQLTATVLLTVPNSPKPAPCFLGYNFHGNHTTTDDPKVTVATSWVRNNEAMGTRENRATEKGRGQAASRWPYKEILDEGFAIATIYYGDIDPDFDDGFQNGIHPLFSSSAPSEPAPQQWGSIGAWAWGLSRAIDYLETDETLDAGHIAVFGHSRLGKTSLWAGANDTRIWLTISNDSGCGGAALHRRKFGETVKIINHQFPHWFCDSFTQYNDQENNIPVDQHQLIALMAPRPIYVASASEDLWADPRGEYLAIAHADAVFELYGDDRMPSKIPPPQHAGGRGETRLSLAIGTARYHAVRLGTVYEIRQTTKDTAQRLIEIDQTVRPAICHLDGQRIPKHRDQKGAYKANAPIQPTPLIWSLQTINCSVVANSNRELGFQ